MSAAQHPRRDSLPLTDWRSKAPHTADDCHFEQCGYCGCCAHGKTLREGCKVDSAPYGMPCRDDKCGCEGRS